MESVKPQRVKPVLRQPQLRGSIYLLKLVVMAVTGVLGASAISAQTSQQLDPKETVSILKEVGQLSITTGRLVATSIEGMPSLNADSHPHAMVAQNFHKKMHEGRLASGTIGVIGGSIATTLEVAGTLDPEPFSKITALASAQAVKAGTDQLAGMAMAASQESAVKLVAAAVNNDASRLQQLKELAEDPDPARLSSAMDDLSKGQGILNKSLGNEPAAKNILEIAFRDAVNKKVDVVAYIAKVNGQKIDNLAADFKEQAEGTRKFLGELGKALDQQADTLVSIHADIAVVQNTVIETRDIAAANLESTRSLASIEFMNWTPQQQLEALNSSLLPGIPESIRVKKSEELQRKISLQQRVQEVNEFSSNLGKMIAIGKNIGVGENELKAVSAVQNASVAIGQYLSGDMRGAAVTVTGMFGGGKPDPNAIMMQYLQKEFEKLHQRLDEIYDLQVKTLQSIDNLQRLTIDLHDAQMKQLYLMEYEINKISSQVRQLQLSPFDDCFIIVDADHLNGKNAIETKSELLSIMDSPAALQGAANCYKELHRTLSKAVVELDLTGSLYSTQIENGGAGQADVVRKEYNNYYRNLEASYEKILSLYKEKKKFGANFTKTYLSVLDPSISVYGHDAKHNAIDVALSSIQGSGALCRKENPLKLSKPALNFVCIGSQAGNPSDSRKEKMWEAKIVGPHINFAMEMIQPLVTVMDFNEALPSQFVPASFIKNPTLEGLARIKNAMTTPTSEQLLSELSQLNELTVFQQSVLYGDETVSVLYDVLRKEDGTLWKNTDENQPGSVRIALEIMSGNSVLAQGVVAMAFYRIVKKQGTFNYYFYKRGIESATIRDPYAGKTCNSDLAQSALRQLLGQNWDFNMKMSASDMNDQLKSQGCTFAEGIAYPGVNVTLGNIEVPAPMPDALGEGRLGVAPTLSEAIERRRKLSMLSLDRSFYLDSSPETRKNFDDISVSLLTTPLLSNTQ